MKKILIFDVNETLLDLAALDPEFERIFGNAGVRREWFAQFIQSAFVTIITDTYQPFGKIGSAAFDMIAKAHGVSVGENDKMAILGKVAQLPPHPEVRAALAKLKEHGFQMATLTNSTYEVAEKQLQNAGISQYFDKILSVDAIQKLKPAKETYEMAAKEFNVQTSGLCLIAAHAWDISGALNAGCSAAFVSRNGMVLDPLSPVPAIVGPTLIQIADQLIASDTEAR
ncbi:MAG TPA: haloacid dehalogenase type II [Candidatus Saccharimonadales bacterium]|nr:haloacid dehalogenase type II [Candidatus Saccharimonadales bacterium]